MTSSTIRPLNILLPARDQWAEAAWVPSLTSHLRRAGMISASVGSAFETLAELIGYPSAPSAAALSRELEMGDASAGHWLLMEPVYLKADLTDAFVVGLSPQLALDLDDARDLADELQDDLPPGVELSVSDRGAWYLRLENRPAISTRVPVSGVGESLGIMLPMGADAPGWTKALNSMQITLHNSAINQRRLSNNLVSVNGMLVWGEGKWPVDPISAKLSVASSDIAIRWLADFSDGSSVDLQDNCEVITDKGHPSLDVLDLNQSGSQVLARFLSDPLALYRQFNVKRIRWWIAGDRCYETSALQRFMFWRRAPGI